MCGIIGVNKEFLNFNNALEILKQRGKDDFGIYKNKNITLGHTRLQIVSDQKQPLEIDDFVIVFNGEIYNYKNLIKEHNLKVNRLSDTEVILRLYQKYGYDSVKLLNGAFAFCIYNKKNNSFFLAKDRFGKRNLYFYKKGDIFIFSSLIKPILTLLNSNLTINKHSLSQYLQYFSPYEETFYKGIDKVPNGSYLVYDGNINIKSYYKIKTYKKIFSKDKAIESIKDVLFDAINIRKEADVDIGVLLSGGIDSSFIASVYSRYKKIKTFSVGYSEFKAYSELGYAKIVSNYINSEHFELEINYKDYIDNFFNTLDALEEPHGDSASVPLYILAKHIDVKSLFSGEGSDELFLGYDNYFKFIKYYKFKESLTKEQILFLDEIISSLSNNSKESEYLRRVVKDENIYNSFGEIFTDIQKRKLFKKIPSSKKIKPKKDIIDWMSYIDIKIWLNSLLTKVDKILGANSKESRNPFLDYRLVDLIFSIDSNIRAKGQKYLLREIAKDYIPKEILNRTKKGFSSPFNEWLHRYFKSYILEVILEVNKETNYFNEEYIKFLYDLSLKNKFKQHIYSLFVFSLWYKKNYL